MVNLVGLDLQEIQRQNKERICALPKKTPGSRYMLLVERTEKPKCY